MNELVDASHAYDINVKDVEQGFILTCVKYPEGFSSTMHSGGHYQEHALMSVGHPPHYFLLKQDGQVVNILKEDAGLLPQFFYAPDQSPWVCLAVYEAGQERENVFPLFQRQGYIPPKSKKEGFLGNDYLGCIGENLYFAWDDADKIQQVAWVKAALGKISTIKLPKSDCHRHRSCYVFDDALHLIQAKAKESFDMLDYLNGLKPKEEMPAELSVQHTLLGEQGEVCQQRELFFSGSAENVYAHHLSFAQTSAFLTLDMAGRIRWVEVDASEQTLETVLHCIHEAFYSITNSVKLAADNFLLTFTTASGNGWLVVCAGQLQSCYIGKGSVYQDAVSGHEIQIPFQGRSIIGACSKTVENGYCIGFYEEGRDRKPAIFFLSKVV